MVLPSESTLRSAAPSVGPDEIARLSDPGVVLAGGTLVELHPPRMGEADVFVHGGTIAQIGGAIPEHVPCVDVRGCFVTPAFVVSHTHLSMALTCGMPPPAAPPRTLIDHLQWIWWPLDKALDDELIHTSALVGAALAAKAGAATVVDLHSSPRAIDGSLDRVEAALDEIGIRGILAYETSDREGRARRDAALKENRRFLKKVRAGQTRHRALVGAHAMMSLNDDTLDALRELSDEFAVGLHLHVAEDATDALDAERNKKTRLEKRLERLGVARPGSIVAQAIELAPEIVAELARAGAFVATTPRANVTRGTGLLGASGDHVTLGTDGIDADVLAEAQAYALRHAAAHTGLDREVGIRIAAGQRLVRQLDEPRSGSLGYGRPAEGRVTNLTDGETGAASAFAVGARADLTVLDYAPMTPMTPANVIEHLVRRWSSAHVRHTIVGGQFVLRDRKLTGIDEEALAVRARPAASRLWERMQGYY